MSFGGMGAVVGAGDAMGGGVAAGVGVGAAGLGETVVSWAPANPAAKAATSPAVTNIAAGRRIG
jgi:hypothetical protein